MCYNQQSRKRYQIINCSGRSRELRQIVFLTLCLLLSACSPYQQESDDISREFQGTFDQSLENQQMAMQQNTVPKPIQEALAHPENTDDQIPWFLSPSMKCRLQN